MEPGRALDALIAEKVLGGAGMCDFLCPRCRSNNFGTDAEGMRCCHGDGCDWSGPAKEALPQFSTDIGAAWLVVEELVALGKSFNVCLGPCRDEGIRSSLIFLPEPDAAGEVLFDRHEADTVAHVICLAALRAVGFPLNRS